MTSKITVFSKYDRPFGVLSLDSLDYVWKDTALNKILNFSFGSELLNRDSENIILTQLDIKCNKIISGILRNSIQNISAQHEQFNIDLLKTGTKELRMHKTKNFSVDTNEIYCTLLKDYRNLVYQLYPDTIAMFSACIKKVYDNGDGVDRILSMFKSGKVNIYDIIDQCTKRYTNIIPVSIESLKTYNPEIIMMNILIHSGYYKNGFEVEENIVFEDSRPEHLIKITDNLHVEYKTDLIINNVNYSSQFEFLSREIHKKLTDKDSSSAIKREDFYKYYYDKIVKKFIDMKYQKNLYLYDYLNAFRSFEYKILDYNLVDEISYYTTKTPRQDTPKHLKHKDVFFKNLILQNARELVRWSTILLDEISPNSLYYIYNNFFNIEALPIITHDIHPSNEELYKRIFVDGQILESVVKVFNNIILNEFENKNWDKTSIIKSEYKIFSLVLRDSEDKSMTYLCKKVMEYTNENISVDLINRCYDILSNSEQKITFFNNTITDVESYYNMKVKSLINCKHKNVFRINCMSFFK